MFECRLLSGRWITRVCGEQINLAEHEANKDTPVVSLCLNSSYDVVEYEKKCGLITSNTQLICSRNLADALVEFSCAYSRFSFYNVVKLCRWLL